jgi:ribonuclease T1
MSETTMSDSASTVHDRLTRLPIFRWLLCTLLVCATATLARTAPHDVQEVALADLPREVQEVYARIGSGGPFRYERDGVTFGNRERLLPSMPRGYYHEYTVRTPGVSSRGARRVVCGGPVRSPEVCYYSDDHYQSFKRIRE